MQRQLLQIADRIPDDILLTLLKCFAQILTREPEPSSQVCGPFIRAFTKLRDDGVEKQFQAIIEEDEDQFKDDKNALQNDGDQECTFNYKIGNIVTQEVIFSMGNNENDANVNGEIIENGQSSHDNYHEMPNLVEPDAEMKLHEEEEKKASDESKINEEEIEEKFEEISKEVENIPEISEQPEDSTAQEPTNDTTDDSEKPQIDEQPIQEEAEQQEQPQVEEEPQQPEQKEERPVIPMEKVTLDDIQREIHEMQMFLFNKGIAPEIKNNSITRNGIVKKAKKVDDTYKVDVCIPLKKGEKKSKSKAILSNYVNDGHHGKHSKADKENHKARKHIFDPTVPNTPEDFLKEKSVTEKIKKQKQNIKHLDVSWQKLCDSQRKVYR